MNLSAGKLQSDGSVGLAVKDGQKMINFPIFGDPSSACPQADGNGGSRAMFLLMMLSCAAGRRATYGHMLLSHFQCAACGNDQNTNGYLKKHVNW